jgi:outer membrane protein OmpA-like peptidoglycan-associated protein
MSARELLARILAAATSIVAAQPAFAYDKAGHFYSVQIMAMALDSRLSRDDADLIAFCAQLPDEAVELDAVETAKTAARRDFLGFIGWHTSLYSAQMLQVQGLLHGLTGESGEELTLSAQRLVGDLLQRALRTGSPPDPDLLCATGFAFHLLGDSFAHRLLAKGKRLYSSPLGHFADNVMPDRPLWAASSLPLRKHDRCESSYTGSDRLLAWEQYFELVRPSEMSETKVSFCEAIKRVEALVENANMGDGWNEEKMRAALLGDEKPRAEVVLHAFKRGVFTSLPTCHTVLACAERASALAQAPTCEGSWANFREAAWEEFGRRSTILESRISEDDGLNVAFSDDGEKYSQELSRCVPPNVPAETLSDVPRTVRRVPLDIEVSNISVMERTTRSRAPHERPPAPKTTNARPAQCQRLAESVGATPVADGLGPGRCLADRWTPDSHKGWPTFHFKTASSLLDDADVSELDRRLGGLTGKRLIVTGFADERGSPESNDELSCERAQSVADALIRKHSLDAKDVETFAAGERYPVCKRTEASSQVECWCRSRRVHVTVVN